MRTCYHAVISTSESLVAGTATHEIAAPRHTHTKHAMLDQCRAPGPWKAGGQDRTARTHARAANPSVEPTMPEPCTGGRGLFQHRLGPRPTSETADA